jgi:hypothetical protein
MPSLGDVANQILDSLNQIQGNTSATAVNTNQIKGDTAVIRNELNAIEGTLVAGFANTEQGLFAILEQSKQTNSLLMEEVQQNNTIICWLTTIAEELCTILRLTAREVELQHDISEGLEFLNDITGLVHAREAVEVHRLERVEEKVDKCCPEPVKPVVPCFRPCETRDVDIYHPKGGDWQPAQTQGTPDIK